MGGSDFKRNVLLLAAMQALFQTTSVLMVTVAGLIGFRLAPDQGLATLPVAITMVGAALTMVPASLLMQRVGRRLGFSIGTSLGVLSAAVAAIAVTMESFALFLMANFLVGTYQGFAQYYRFAAGEVSEPGYRARAISWVVSGGVVAAIAGPNIARFTGDLGSVPFFWSFICLLILSTLALLLSTRLTLPLPDTGPKGAASRSTREIVAQPAFLTALLGSAVGYGVMVMVMTATPLAMQICGHGIGQTTTVIQWHVLGMFVPSFFTGHLIGRVGVLPVMGTGALLLAGHVFIALSGVEYLHFLSGLILLGVGWNFLFIGGTSLLADSSAPSDRAKAQAIHDFLVFGVITAASFSAGKLLNAQGWEAVNLLALPFLLAVVCAVGALAWYRRSKRLPSLLQTEAAKKV